MRIFLENVYLCLMQMTLSTSELEVLRRLQRNLAGSSDYARVTCILMLGKGNSPSFVADCLGIDVSTVYRYRTAYLHGGESELLENRHKGYWGLLDSRQLSALREELTKHVYTDAKSVAKWIKSAFGIEYTASGTVDLLNRIGFSYKKTTEVPCEACASAQEAFAKEVSDLFSALPDDAVVYYADGVHPTHNSRSTYAWIEKGKKLEQPTVSGRDRVNINGLLNAHDVTDVIAHDCVSVNAQSTKELYQAALEKHPKASCIYVISDNARYYHNKELKEWAEGTRIKQLFLPPYSPNLNLIERLWKFLRKKVINTGFYRTKEEFRNAVKHFFEHIGRFKKELESLLTLKFRLINSQTISF